MNTKNNSIYREALDYAEHIINIQGKSNGDVFKGFTRLDYEHLAGLLLLSKPEQDRDEYVIEADSSNGKWLPELSAKVLINDDLDAKEDLIKYIKNSLVKAFGKQIDALIQEAYQNVHPQWAQNDEEMFRSLRMRMHG